MWRNCFLNRNAVASYCRSQKRKGAPVSFSFNMNIGNLTVPLCTARRSVSANRKYLRPSVLPWISGCQQSRTYSSYSVNQHRTKWTKSHRLGWTVSQPWSQHMFRTGLRFVSTDSRQKKSERSVLIYISAMGIFMIGMAYAGVPLYRIFCQSSGLGGQAVKGHDTTKVETMAPVKDRVLKVRFNADTASSMQWNFRPQQAEVNLLPGETALAFYTAKNPTDKPIIGISTYNVVPFEAGQYFNKIQCFCFEEQRLNPHEEVDMPVFFYIDPDYVDDPKLELADTITLSYTFFEAKEGVHLPVPSYATARH